MTRKGRSLDDVELPPWRFIAFTDLHFGGKTMERCLRVLARVRELALEHKAWVVFCGDFFDTRGVLAIRHLDPLFDEFYRWRDAGIRTVIIPGNHDQVTLDGRLHGVRVFEPFSNIQVATDPLLWRHRKIAFLPWREDPGEQSALFDALGEHGDDWTVFAHAEVRGARTNYGYEAPGRVSMEQISLVAKRAFLGHYHMRQKFTATNGSTAWYLGNPFELTFGEMGDPKGLALITEDSPDPHWIPLEGFAQHHRLTYGVPFDVGAIAPQDIVELYAPPKEMASEEVRAFIDTIPAEDVRPLPLDVEEEPTVPEFALSLDQAIDRYVDELEGDADLKSFGRAILGELPEARAVQPLTPQVVIQSVNVTDFCSVRGNVSLALDQQGLVLLKGPVGIGKTALADAITWALYGQTSPRKANSAGATFRGDEVIHDNADACEVTVQIALPLLKKNVCVKRTKERGKGAKVKVQGIDTPNGISDTQALIDHVIGMNYSLWRTCVSLGQGAVGNFVTDADKARKAMLSEAFGLNACGAALKYVRDRLKPLRVKMDKLELDLAAEQRALAVLGDADYTEQADHWEQQREAAKASAEDSGRQAQTTIDECTKHLAQKDQWTDLQAKHQEHVGGLQKQLSAMVMGEDLVKLEREHGGYASEQALLQQQLGKSKKEHGDLEAAFEITKAELPCPTCGQPMKNTQSEKLVADKASEVQRLERGIRTLNTKMQNVAVKLGDLRKGHTSRRDAIDAQIAESTEALEKVGQALNTFTRFEMNKAEAERRLTESRAVWKEKDTEVNPFRARAEEHEAKLTQTRATITTLEAGVVDARAHCEQLEFWEAGFSAKGLPVLVLRTALHELELYANRFLARFLGGRLYTQLTMAGDDLGIQIFEQCDDNVIRERRYEQLSGGMRRCVELAFAPFALSEMVFNRCGVRIPLLVIDEVTTHLGTEEKPLVCEVLRSLVRDTVLVIDHDVVVAGEFDHVLEMTRSSTGTTVKGAA